MDADDVNTDHNAEICNNDANVLSDVVWKLLYFLFFWQSFYNISERAMTI